MVLPLTSFLEFLQSQFVHTSSVEWLAVTAGFICIYLAAKESIWNWPVSLISVISYGFLFYKEAMYGDMTLQIYFLGTGIYGWYFWLNKKTEIPKPITSLSGRGWLISIVSIIVLSLLLGLFMANYTNSTVPYADGFCTSVSFAAQILLTRKILQNWLLWVFVNICYIPLFLYKHLNLSAILYFVLIAIAYKGYLDWKEKYREQTN